MLYKDSKCKPLAVSLLGLLACGTALAQDGQTQTGNANTGVTQLSAINAQYQQEESAFDPVVGYVAQRSATATRTDTPLAEIPQSITVIGVQQIKDQGSTNLAEALRYTPGINSTSSGADDFGDWFQMRGFGARTFEDGISETQHVRQKADVRIEPYAYERIEVLRGPSSIISGNNFPGGVVNLVSKRPLAENFRELSFSYANHDYKKISSDLSGPIDKDSTWLYRLITVGYHGGTQVDYAKTKRFLIRPVIRWRPETLTDLTFFAEYQRDSNNTVLGYLPYYGTVWDRPIGNIPFRRFISEPSWDKARGIAKRFGWELSKEFNSHWKLSHHFRFSHNDRVLQTLVPAYWDGDSVFVDANGIPDVNFGPYLQRTVSYEAERRNAFVTDFLLQGKFRTGRLQHHALFAFDMSNIRGTDAYFEDMTSPLNVYDPQYGNFVPPDLSTVPCSVNKLKSFGFTVQDQTNFADTILLTGALRYDLAHTQKNLESQTDHRVSPRIGLVWKTGYGFSPYLSYSESFQSVFGQRKYDGTLAKPLYAKQIEAGIKWQSVDKNVIVNAAVYKIKEQNGIAPDLSHPGYIEQIAERTSRGFELEAALNFRDWNIVSQYTYNRHYFSNVDIYRDNQLNQQMSGMPRHLASLWAVHKFGHLGLPNLRAGAGVMYRGKTGDGVKNGVTVPSATTLDLMMSYETGPMTLSLNINNLTDKRYFSFCDSSGDCGYAPGRRIVSNVSYRW